jgi:hypothetical protein
MKLAPVFERTFNDRLCWLESMLRRLGRKVTLALWKQAFREPDDGLSEAIFAARWRTYEEQDTDGGQLNETADTLFASPVEDVSRALAHQLVMMDPGLRLAKKRFPSLRVKRQITAYESLHLRLDGVARLATAMQSYLGKEGELLAYDLCREQRIAREAVSGENRGPAEVLKEWADLARTAEPNLFNAGLSIELIKEIESEVVLHVTACEWARYFQERHPSVAYLVACSTDEAALRAVTDRLFLQRTSTIMEGAEICDFRLCRA